MVLSFLSDRSVFTPSDKCAESTAIAGKKQKSLLVSKEKKVKNVVDCLGF